MLCSRKKTDGSDRPSGIGTTLRTCPITLSGFAALGFLVVLGTVWVTRHVETVKSAISETALASLTLYHVSSATHATVEEEGHGHAAGTDALIQASHDLRLSVENLTIHIEHAHDVHREFWAAPVDALAHELGLVSPPDAMTVIWQGGPEETTIAALLYAQLTTCDFICVTPDLSSAEKSVKLAALNDVVVNQLLPRLTKMRDEATAWQDRLLVIANVIILIAFACIIASILFTRFGVVGPLLKDLASVNAKLTQENDALEQKVSIRTQDLKLALDRAEDAHEARTRFLGSVNHEMRTPLNGVLGIAALLQTTQLDDRQAGYVETIMKSGQILIRLIDDVLDYVSLNAGKMHLISQSIDLREVISDSLTLLYPVASAKGLALYFDSSGGTASRVDADPDRLQQIVNNVVGNAIKFTETGNVRVLLEQRELGRNMHVLLRIEDTGTGIAQDKRDRIFEPFDRAALGVPTKGAGLGLAVTKALVEEMSGSITVKSEKGEGSLFTIRLQLPLTVAQDASEPQAA